MDIVVDFVVEGWFLMKVVVDMFGVFCFNLIECLKGRLKLCGFYYKVEDVEFLFIICRLVD